MAFKDVKLKLIHFNDCGLKEPAFLQQASGLSRATVKRIVLAIMKKKSVQDKKKTRPPSKLDKYFQI